MNTYIVSYLSFFDNVIEHKAITAESELMAGLKMMRLELEDINGTELDDLHDYCANTDSTITITPLAIFLKDV